MISVSDGEFLDDIWNERCQLIYGLGPFEALISLPRKIPSNQAIRPVKLSQNCGEDLDEKDAITAGKGGEGIDSPVRYAILKIRPRKWCRKVLLKTTNIKPNSVICAYSVFGQTIFNGDSGTKCLMLCLTS